MPRGRRPHLKQRKDGRYRKVYKGQQIMGDTEDEVYDKLDAIVALEQAWIRKVVPVEAYAKQWLPIAFPAVKPATYRGNATHMEKLVDVIGNETLDKVTPSMIKEVYSTKYVGLSNSYIKAGRQLFCSFFDAAVADGLCRTNPARNRAAAPHKGNPVKKVEFTQQHRKWIETLCTDHRCHPIAMAMLYAGLRPPEAKALKIERDVDFENDLITLSEFAHLDDTGQKYEFSETGKNERATRTIPLFPPLKKALEGKEGYLITSARGGELTPTTWRVAWNSYLFEMETAINGCQKRWYGKTKEHKKMLAAGIPLPEWIEFKVTPYTLRKAFCRWGRDNGVEINTMIRWMGHADAKMILAVYDEVSNDRSLQEADRLRKKLFKVQNEVQKKN